MIPRNIFLMWDKPRPEWPPIVRFCVDMWERLNPDWTVRVYNIEEAWAAVRDDIPLEVFDSLRPPAQSDVLRTKLLATHGGMWVDASCLPHMPLSHWITNFEDTDLSALPTGSPGRRIASWFLISRSGGRLITEHYRNITKYLSTTKLYLPQDPNSISIIEQNWKDYVSDYAAHTLHLLPYFWWHYLFTSHLDRNIEFKENFDRQKSIYTEGRASFLMDRIKKYPPQARTWMMKAGILL
jgi:hypothetical protein